MALVVIPRQTSITPNGVPRVGAFLYFYEAGTNTPIPTYTTPAFSVEHPVPVPSNSDGYWPAIYVNLTSITGYKIVAKDADGLTLFTEDNQDSNSDASLRADLASTTVSDDGARIVNYRRDEAGSVARSVHAVLSHIVYLEDFGGAPGAGDNSAAMYAAEAALAAVGGGKIKIGTLGEWRMNWVCTTKNIHVEGCGGQGDHNKYCVRPFDIADGPAMQWGNGVITDLYYGAITNIHFSGTSVDGNDPDSGEVAAASDETAYSADYCFRILGSLAFRATNCWFYNGKKTLAIEPATAGPATDIKFFGCKGRNDILDDDTTRLMYFRREADPAYFTDVAFYGWKGNKPGKGYTMEIDGAGCVPIFEEGYIDCEPYWGVFWNGSGAIRSTFFDVDPGTTGVVCFTTTQPLASTNRFIFGNLTQGGQRMAFLGTVTDLGSIQSATDTTAVLRAALALNDDDLNGYLLRITGGTGAGQQRLINDFVGATDTCTVDEWDVNPDATSTYEVHPTILLLAEADWHLYRPRISRASFDEVNYFAPPENPSSTDVSIELPAADRLEIVGANWSIATVGKGLRVKEGSNAKQGTGTLAAGSAVVNNSSVTANSRIFVTSNTDGGTPGWLRVSARSNGVSFTVTSSSGTDTSTFAYQIFEPA